jgi:GTP-binding protein
MLPILALVGRPNVGKSTLFNRLTASRNALVADVPGLTRDRHHGWATVGDRRIVVVDTGGLAGEDELAVAAEAQTWQAVAEADCVLFMVDARNGLVPADETLAQRLRAAGKPVLLVANKAEGLPSEALAEFHALGFPRVIAVSAKRGTGLAELTRGVAENLPEAGESQDAESEGLPVAVIGRPNVGKSTLMNRLLGEERLLATDIPGTTRDAIRVPLERRGKRYVFIDTAGFRRRSSVEEGAERLGVLAAIRALEAAKVAVIVTDAREGITGQDQRLVRLALERGRAVVIALNKWDDIPPDARHHATVSSDRRLAFVPFARQLHISALRGSGLGELMHAVDEAGAALAAELATPDLNRVLRQLVEATPPPLARGRRIKLRYAHQAGKAPPAIKIHGTQVGRLPASYRRYLAAGFREVFELTGVPLVLQFKSPPNPYADKPRNPRRRRR